MSFVSFESALKYLNDLAVVAIPTETVYGLAANGTNDQAVAKIYALKNRPQFNPLIMHVPDIAMAENWAVISPLAHELMQEFWYKRGASISFVLNLRERHPLSLLALAGLNTVAVRRPNHALAIKVLKNLDFPLAAPSANRSNSLSPTCANHVMQSLGDDVPVLDGGECTVGLESTIVDLTKENITVLRLGSVTALDLEEFGAVIIADPNAAITAPGMLKRHYAPNRPLKINVVQKEPGMAFLGFGSCVNAEINITEFNLSESANLVEAATNLFKYLHKVDRLPFTSIGVAPIPNYGIGEAINDRLKRACSEQ
jgi:L-threonylcarbamoyladenylate synthase